MSDEAIKRSYWMVTAVLLSAGIAGWAPGLSMAIGVTAVQTAHFAWRTRSLRSMPVQVRAGYLAVLLLGLWSPLSLLHVLQLGGVSVLLATGYCPMARLLALAPWNRTVPLTAALARWILFSPPAPGSVIDRIPAALADAQTARAPSAPYAGAVEIGRFPTRSEDAGKRIA
jgi:hypothetical protein